MGIPTMKHRRRWTLINFLYDVAWAWDGLVTGQHRKVDLAPPSP